MSETWVEFRQRCAATVQKIRSTKDEGVYAKQYDEDVTSLLLMVSALDRPHDAERSLAQHVWEDPS